MTQEPLILLSRPIADRLVASGATQGWLSFKSDDNKTLLVGGYSTPGSAGGDNWVRNVGPSSQEHYLGAAGMNGANAHWYRVSEACEDWWRFLANRGLAMSADEFKSVVRGRWEPSTTTMPFVTVWADEDGSTEFLAWIVSGDRVGPVGLDVIENPSETMFPLARAWPLSRVKAARVVAIGAGSIGSAAIARLAEYGVGTIDVVDPDRLLSHNVARHRLTARYVGMTKVRALREWAAETYPAADIRPHELDVIDDADAMRQLLLGADAVVTTTDGVEPRRSANHLAVRAGVTNVLACVLEDGAFGEVLRVIPRVTACLWCSRQRLAADGSMDIEHSLDRGYGTGSWHLPMTAVTGDLALVADLAAKMAISTILHRAGYREQVPPGDACVVGLRPLPDRAPPFDLSRAGEVRWRELGQPDETCPTCLIPSS